MKNIMDVLEQVTTFIVGKEQDESLLDKKKKTIQKKGKLGRVSHISRLCIRDNCSYF